MIMVFVVLDMLFLVFIIHMVMVFVVLVMNLGDPMGGMLPKLNSLSLTVKILGSGSVVFMIILSFVV